MKMKSIICMLLAGATAVSLTGFSTGTASQGGGNRTGSPGSSGAGCEGSGCHDNTSSAIIMTMQLVDVISGDTIRNQRYIPGRSYIVRLIGSNTLTGVVLPKFGFQSLVRTNSGASPGVLFQGANVQISVVGQDLIAEQATPISGTSNNYKDYQASFMWIAPSQATGPVTFYHALCAVNDDGTRHNDYGNTLMTTFTEGPVSVAEQLLQVQLEAYPNPVTNQLQLRMEQAQPGTYELSLVDFKGRQLQRHTIEVQQGSHAMVLPMSDLASGVYMLQLSKGAQKQTLKIIKN